MPLPAIATRPGLRDPHSDPRRRLAEELLAWWEHEQQEWDSQIAGDETPADDLWSCMPAVDSKTVARMAPIFKKHGHPFNVRHIRRGGYGSIQDVIRHLVLEE
ncbi:MAG: hypothetical protein F4Z04_06360 [Acidobacteria bacterium]|nr:hypothetical protein [Acidobacteriota bacterium]